MARVLKREAAKRDLIAQWVWYAQAASFEVAYRFLVVVRADHAPPYALGCAFWYTLSRSSIATLV